MHFNLVSDTQFFLRLILALSLGSLIGIERQWRQRLAGLRTNALVAAGSALFMMLTDVGEIGGDATRIPAQIVSGIGFLGAGVIMKEGLSIKGLNTAATIWCASAVGCLAGMGLLSKSFIGALIVLGTNVLLRPIAQRINRQPKALLEEEFKYQIKIVCREDEESHVRFVVLQAVSSCPLVLRSIDSQDLNGSHKVKVTADVISPNKQDALLEQVVSRLSLEKGVSAARWQITGQEAVA